MMVFNLKFSSKSLCATVIHICVFNVLYINTHQMTVKSSSVTQGCGTFPISTKSSKIPWEAKLERQDLVDISWTAVIINENLLLAGINSVLENSVLRIISYEKYFVFTNLSINFAFTDKDDPYVQRSKITHLRPHPEYQLEDDNAANNYVLIHLRKSLTFGSNINSICLPSDEDLKYLYQPSGTDDKNRIFISSLNKFFTKTVRKTNKTIFQDFLCANISDGGVYGLELVNSSDNYHINENKWSLIAPISGEYTNLQYTRGVLAVKDVFNNGAYFFMGFLSNPKSTDNCDCPIDNPIFIPKLNTVTLQWIHNNTRCGPKQYTCNDGACISLEKVCNRNPECSDNSDEDPKFCRGLNYCEVDQFPCGTYGKCISRDNVCDSVVDCENEEDERACGISEINSSTLIWKIVGPVLAVLGTFVLVGVYFIKKNVVRIRNLTDDEVKEFKDGFVHQLDTQEINRGNDLIAVNLDSNGYDIPKIHGDHEYLNNLIRRLKWSEVYEIAKSKVFTNKAKILGKGEYGVVYEGVFMERSSGNYSVCRNVAIKTLKSCPDIMHFKALLDELKILAYLRKHEYIVELVGANTENIKLRNLEVIMEYCPHGSLKDYIQNNLDSFVWLNFIDGKAQLLNPNENNEGRNGKHIFTTLHLLRWCLHVANAMDYLTSKHVIHGDLAIRNILLAFDFVAKVGDFGLSRKLYEYRTLYTHNKVALPIRWLSIESLREFAFSHKSDVWSFGVVWWELFTLGSLPYEEVKYEINLYSELCAGLRLKKPEHATEEMFNVVKTCWNSNPSSRPSFKELKDAFTSFETHFIKTNNFP